MALFAVPVMRTMEKLVQVDAGSAATQPQTLW